MKTELFSVLKILSPDEFKQLRIVVKSPLYQSNAKSEKLYSALRAYYPDFNLSPKDCRIIYKKVFPNKDFNQNALQKVLNALLKTVEAYLLNLSLKKNEILKEQITILSMEKHSNLFSLFQKTQEKLHKLLDKEKVKNANYWSEKENVYDQLYSNQQYNKYSTDDETLDKLNNAVDFHFVHTKLHYNLLLQKESESDTLPLRFEKNIENLLKDETFSTDNLLQVYSLLSALDTAEKMSKFKKLEEQLNTEERAFISKLYR